MTGVAEGRFEAGMTLDFLARAAVANGSPVEIAAPEPGAVELYAPVAVFATTPTTRRRRESFAGFLLTRPGAGRRWPSSTGTPIRSDVPPLAPAVERGGPGLAAVFEQPGRAPSGLPRHLRWLTASSPRRV